ncbi:hypothetical protein M8T31_24070, partial [Enterobacter hormaechei]|nr:hypothetical protein [Enterobacter hormaechei]
NPTSSKFIHTWLRFGEIMRGSLSAKRLVWSATEIQNKEVPLVATIRETKVNSMTVGDFEATATFEFSYE